MDISYRSGPAWHVAYVEPRHEFKTCDEIVAAGFDAYCPAERLRGKPRLGPKRADPIIRPLFPRYLFVAFDPDRSDWTPLLRVDGVYDVLRNNGVPSRIPGAWVAALRKAEQVGMFDRTAHMPVMFKVGEQVRISDGSFAGFHAVIAEFVAKMRSTTARKRARVLFAFMGRMAAIDLPVTSLEKL